MPVRYARPGDKPALINIWQKCFSDSEQFVSWNFENNFKYENAMVCEEGGRIVSNLHLIPYDICFCKKNLKGIYISAVATLSGCRGKGFASALISAALSEIKRRKADIAFLVPAINGYYERFGFIKIAEKSTYVKKSEETFVSDEKLISPDPAAILKIYLSANNNKKLWLKRSLKNTELILDDLLKNTGGKCKMLSDGSAYAMYKKSSGKIKVFELMGSSRLSEERMLRSLFYFGKELEFELPPLMVKPLNAEKIRAENIILPQKDLYFNLIL